MGIIWMIIQGICIGWIVTMLADYLPRFAATQQPIETERKLLRIPAWWGMITRNKHAMVQDDFKIDLAVEVLGGLVFGVLAYAYGFNRQVVLLGGFFIFFLLIGLIDIKYRLILNILVYPAIMLTILFQLWFVPSSGLAMILGGGLAFGVFYVTAWLRPGDLGGGDVKLAGLLGLIFGFPGILWVLLIGTFTGGINLFVLSRIRQGQGKLYMPYAPFLCLGAMVALVYNPSLFV